MIAFLNGRFVPEEQAFISVLDRGFLLGDGLFTTIPVFGGRPFCWPQHLARLESGARTLGISLGVSSAELAALAAELVRKNALPESVLRLTLTRGVGPRGYSPRNAGPAALAMTLHPLPANDPANPPIWRLAISSFRLPPGDLLSRCKHSSRLVNVMARCEAESRGADEALLLNTAGNVVEAAAANLFWVEADAVRTPPVADGALPGITRSLVLGLCRDLGITTRVASVQPAQLHRAQAAFLTLSTRGVVEASALDEVAFSRSTLVAALRVRWHALVASFRRGEPVPLAALCVFPPHE